MKASSNEIDAGPTLVAPPSSRGGIRPKARETGPSAVAGCFHCGEPCSDPSLVQAGKIFCCRGCRAVHDLLTQSGLGHFYDLNRSPGVRMRQTVARSRFAYLDDPAVQQRLLDFTDGKTNRVTFRVPAIHCVACVWLLENLFRLHPGIGLSRANFARREVTVTFIAGKITLGELAALLASIGYEPELTFSELEKAAPSPLRKRAWTQIGLAAFGFGNIMLMSLPFYLGLDSLSGPWFKAMAGWLSLALALPVVTFSAADFWRAAWVSLRQRVLTLEIPIVLGLAAIYGQSAFLVVTHLGPGYCDSLCGLIFFLLCGRLFQKKTYDRLIFDRDYKGFFPLAVVRRITGGEETVAISQLKTGDRLVLRNGELLPADANLIRGEACMDYSFVTGESEPVNRVAGDHLYAGGRQTGGAIEVETVKPVAQSYLASLWNHEAFRKTRDNDLDSLTNRYSRQFTRLVVGVAAAAAVFWLIRDPAKSLKAFTSVLIVACPCALALAAPLTHGTAQRLLARRKIFLKNALVIERMAGVDTIVLDKTGTLTISDARGVTFRTAEGGNPEAEAAGHGLSLEEEQWISSIARHSAHPNSVRLANSLPSGNLPVANFRETPGCGIAGEVAGHRIRLGSRAWVATSEMPGAGRWIADGSVFVSVDEGIRGAFAFESSLRPEVERLVAQLGGKFDLALLSGDNEREAPRFRKLFGGRTILKFKQSPADKLDFIRELQRRGRRVMMVGDGLNDAGALKQADVGAAVVERIGIFSPASDVILDASELPRLARVLSFSRSATRVVRAGFVISALYNVLGVGFAAAGLLAPIICAILMPISTATVVLISCSGATWAARRSGFLTRPMMLALANHAP